MARHDGEPRLADEPAEERLRQRGPFDGIGAGGDLVEEDERALGRRVEDRNEVPDVSGERGEAHLDRLLVADVGQHVVEDGQLGVLGRRAQAALVHRGEPEGLERDGLTARVGAADHDCPQVARLEVDRHRGPGIQQRMPRPAQANLVPGCHLRPAPPPREDAEGHREVDLADGRDESGQRFRLVADLA